MERPVPVRYKVGGFVWEKAAGWQAFSQWKKKVYIYILYNHDANSLKLPKKICPAINALLAILKWYFVLRCTLPHPPAPTPTSTPPPSTHTFFAQKQGFFMKLTNFHAVWFMISSDLMMVGDQITKKQNKKQKIIKKLPDRTRSRCALHKGSTNHVILYYSFIRATDGCEARAKTWIEVILAHLLDQMGILFTS